MSVKQFHILYASNVHVYLCLDATEKMDAILSSNTAWERLTNPDMDDMKITECADAFLTLLITISDRYKHLPQPGHR